ncbi:lysine decarboxylase [Staphylococcus lutrae]|uniref:Lysine decarboxylase n=1 Tax=Staphylococcus lutrae TaxID=155085 RepID=A0AAC9RUG3_9STAP|nr:lysine decarboxylase [Staphylococcus lutrae]ARJ51025.1 lysine decarboxylase [Staphylococcus lutrae]PNZ38513.1 lysine decarboxylase [Staphylococcus lutrae]
MREWQKNQPISMHVPGHKNGTIGMLSMTHPAYDTTEITGFDNLHHAEGVLYESMTQLNKHPDYQGYFLVNGTTSGILAVIHAFSGVEGPVNIARNVHKSVFNALDLGDQYARILPTTVSERTGQYLKPDIGPELTPQTKLAVLTYPNYYGETFDIKQSVEHFHRDHVPVLVDEAHGAHFDLPGFPSSSLQAGADYVVQSYHKTLPSLTMSSVLWIHKAAPNRHRIEQGLQIFQSSSPSYLLMESLESAHHFYQFYQSNQFFEKRQQLIEKLRDKGCILVIPEDPLKLLIRYEGLSGSDIQVAMEAQHIYSELADEASVLWVLPLWHREDRFPFALLLERIARMVFKPSVEGTLDDVAPLYTQAGSYEASNIVETIALPFHQAVGYRLATHLTPYPPGIPSLLKGEKITEDMVKLIEYWQLKGFHVEGLKNGKIIVKDE